MATDQPQVIHAFERIGFPDFAVSEVVAKIDTGAYTGAIHCSEIKLVRRNGKRLLRFVPIDEKYGVQYTDHFRRIPVTSSNGLLQWRYAIETSVVIRDKTYAIRLSLANREGMKYPVLIGRRFLRHNKFMVDATQYKK